MTIRATLVYRDPLPQRVAGWMATPRISWDCQSYFGVRRYSATESGLVNGKSRYIPGLSVLRWCKSWDILGLSKLLWCTEILCLRGWLGGWQVVGYPRLLELLGASPGISRDCQSYFDVPRYSATEGGWGYGKSWDVPGLV